MTPAFENLCDRRRSLKSASVGSHPTTNIWKRDRNSVTATNIHTMSTILEECVERPQTSLGKAEHRTVDSRTSTTSEGRITPGPARCGFGNNLTQTSNQDRPAESFHFTVFRGLFEGQCIPSSPLHEF